MKKIVLLTSCFVIICQLNAQNLAELLKDKMDAKYEEYVTRYRNQGIAASVVFEDGSVWEYAAGTDGGVEIKPNFLFEFASNTKTMTAAMIFKLQEEGKLSINDTIYKYISPIKHVPSGITIKNLLQHKSGIFDYTHNDDFYDMIFGNHGKFISPDTVFSYLKAPYDPVGAKWQYCNTGYVLLGKVIEAAAQESYVSYLDKTIRNPIRLDNTFVGGFEQYNAPKIGGYFNGRFQPNEVVSFLSTGMADGGIVSSTKDMALWTKRLFSGAFLDTNSFKQLTEISLARNTISWATGCNRSTYKGKQFWGHGGSSLFMHSSIQFSEQRGYGYAAAVNSDDDRGSLGSIESQFLPWLDNEMRFALSTQELKNAIVNVYPNPSHDKIQINLPQNLKGELNYQIMNNVGRVVKKGKISSNSNEINLSALLPSSYMLLLHLTNTSVQSVRFTRI